MPVTVPALLALAEGWEQLEDVPLCPSLWAGGACGAWQGQRSSLRSRGVSPSSWPWDQLPPWCCSEGLSLPQQSPGSRGEVEGHRAGTGECRELLPAPF